MHRDKPSLEMNFDYENPAAGCDGDRYTTSRGAEFARDDKKKRRKQYEVAEDRPLR
jgi:hypothetical protein